MNHGEGQKRGPSFRATPDQYGHRLATVDDDHLFARIPARNDFREMGCASALLINDFTRELVVDTWGVMRGDIFASDCLYQLTSPI